MESQKRPAVKNYLRVRDLGEFEKCNKLCRFVCDGIPEKFIMESKSASPSKGPEIFESFMASFYDRYLDLDRKVLAWVLIVDGIFVLNFIENDDPQLQEQSPVSKQPNGDVKPRLGVINHDLERLVPDILMLENQIPLYLLWTITKEHLINEFPDARDIHLFNTVRCFCTKHSPLRLSGKREHLEAAFDRHILHFMYRSIVSNNIVQEDEQSSGKDDKNSVYRKFCIFAEEAVKVFWQVVDKVNDAIEIASSSGLKIPGNIEKVTMVLQPLGKKSKNNDKEIHLAAKIDIPSALKLEEIGKITFAKIDGGIQNIRIDKKYKKLFLPEIHLRANSEVILRNLAAYEATEPGYTPELAEYLDLVCGIIHTAHDVEFLRKKDKEIVIGDLPNEEIVRIFNGFNRSTATKRLRKNSKVCNVVKGANEIFDKHAVVKAWKCIMKLLVVMERLFPLVALALLSLQIYYQSHGGWGSPSRGYAAEKRDDPSLTDMDASSLSLSPQDKVMIARKLSRY